MTRGDKAALRLTIGLGLAVFVAYGLGLQAPFVVCIMALLVLCKPGPPLPMVKSLVIAGVFAALVAAGVLMVPLLENYAAAGVLLTAVLLFWLFYLGRLRASPLTTVLVLAFALIPVAGVQEQALIGVLALTLAVGVLVGAAVSAASNAVFPDPPAPSARAAATRAARSRERALGRLARHADRDAGLRARADQPVVLPGGDHEDGGAGPAGRRNRRPPRRARARRLDADGRADRPGGMAWPVAVAEPVDADAVADGRRAVGRIGAVRRPAHGPRPSFWSNALITSLILLGPAIEDSASGKSVLEGAVMRVTLFVGVALYAWATVWALERWRARRPRPTVLDVLLEESP